MIGAYAGVAAFVLVTVAIGAVGYVTGYIIANMRANKRILKVSELAIKEIENTHKAYIEYLASPGKNLKPKSKNTVLKIIRSDNDKDTPSNK
jgi:alanine dehydrogenase